jgi:carotenoid 1,2-hydratase
VALYGERDRAWALTEHPQAFRDARSIAIGPSSASWEGDTLVLRLDERTAPGRGRLRGTVRVHPRVRLDEAITLDAEGLHTWRPHAPLARVEVALDAPNARWSGHGYVDGNDGECALEETFRGWSWSRALLPSSRVVLAYDTISRDGGDGARGTGSRVSRIIDAHGTCSAIDLTAASLRSTRWRIERTIRADAESAPVVARSLEDTPFYARALVDVTLDGEPARAMHEVLSLDRFQSGWVRFLLPFRMRRG